MAENRIPLFGAMLQARLLATAPAPRKRRGAEHSETAVLVLALEHAIDFRDQIAQVERLG